MIIQWIIQTNISHRSACRTLSCILPSLYLDFLNWSISDLQYYISFRCITQWFDIFVHYRMITQISLVTMSPYARSRSSAHGKGHEEGGSAYTKAGSSLRNPPGNFRASTPPNQSLPTFCFHLHLWLYRGCPPLPLSGKRVSLQLQLIIPGYDSV